MKLRRAASLALVAMLALSATSVSAASKGERADKVDNKPSIDTAGKLLLSKNARLTRTKDGLGISMKLITPEAGDYVYPETIPQERQAQPEMFTGWVFIFNNPENCKTNPGETFPCGPQDFNDEVRFGAYNFSGFTNSLGQISGGEIVLNPASDGFVMLDGDVAVGQQQRPPVAEGTTTHPLENPMGAEVHVAIAPHGQIDFETLATELYSPVGNPSCDCWWVATFSADV